MPKNFVKKILMILISWMFILNIESSNDKKSPTATEDKQTNDYRDRSRSHSRNRSASYSSYESYYDYSLSRSPSPARSRSSSYSSSYASYSNYNSDSDNWNEISVEISENDSVLLNIPDITSKLISHNHICVKQTSSFSKETAAKTYQDLHKHYYGDTTSQRKTILNIKPSQCQYILTKKNNDIFDDVEHIVKSCLSNNPSYISTKKPLNTIDGSIPKGNNTEFISIDFPLNNVPNIKSVIYLYKKDKSGIKTKEDEYYDFKKHKDSLYIHVMIGVQDGSIISAYPIFFNKNKKSQ